MNAATERALISAVEKVSASIDALASVKEKLADKQARHKCTKYEIRIPAQSFDVLNIIIR